MVEIPVNATGASDVIIQIPSEPSSLQILLVIGTFAAVSVALFGVFLSNRRTKESNKLLKRDIESRIRPWVKISDILPFTMFMINGDALDWKTYNNQKIKGEIPIDFEKTVNFTYVIINVGSLATKIDRNILGSHTEFSKEKLKEVKKKQVINIIPNEEFRSSLNLSYKEFTKLNEKPFYFGINLDYEWDGGKSSVGKIWKITTGRSTILDSW